jgi:hypothetical protein
MMFAPKLWQVQSKLAGLDPRVGIAALGLSRRYHDSERGPWKPPRSFDGKTERNGEQQREGGWYSSPWRSRAETQPSGGLETPDRPLLSYPTTIFRISPEVTAALKKRLPVVALESTIYTHGFPYPENVALALDLENIVRAHGAIPATIGILNGLARVGLSSHEIKTLASGAGNPETMKVSRRDLPYILGMVGDILFSE